MTNLTLRHTVVGIVAGVLLAAPAVWAQQPQAPASGAHDSPRPDELEPGVNTSAVPPPSQPAPAAAASASGSDSTSGPASAKTPPASDGSNAGVSKAPGRAKAAAGTAGTAGEGQQDKKANIDGQQDKKANAARGGKAEDHLQLDTTDITGNQELPKVLYIVPWKRSDLGDLLDPIACRTRRQSRIQH